LEFQVSHLHRRSRVKATMPAAQPWLQVHAKNLVKPPASNQ
jgi:hypothetical protein